MYTFFFHLSIEPSDFFHRLGRVGGSIDGRIPLKYTVFDESMGSITPSEMASFDYFVLHALSILYYIPYIENYFKCFI